MQLIKLASRAGRAKRVGKSAGRAKAGAAQACKQLLVWSKLPRSASDIPDNCILPHVAGPGRSPRCRSERSAGGELRCERC